uniref:Uncharacterized protein n=1 Tax=Lactuca sativa TaxID=4236 RepID=A0A9R1VX14_LACSA|nr:hypothetical protein LSAT_V11C400169760 [Lactuca sativa]
MMVLEFRLLLVAAVTWGWMKRNTFSLAARLLLRLWKGSLSGAIFPLILLHRWIVQNDKIFNKMCITSSKLADNIITMVFCWVKHRGKYRNCIWSDWGVGPFNIL